ncbi:GLPGLI family protein [Kaistella flava (ex Peng et al. 2021)]|uniref:GLPGLI family protein n=1 Tax=Kaistella flava (ex Peng et al. 2021) TaxID=2038776 RepID=A0A7M2YC75_9FLAO|nr:GLPGLI family protein [Kaistella flava (ex Peng et al. 2021)]QOW11439.1 GLPGLI family protein [Kaistella flava (ex Peng et al. 2021)]
MKNILLILVFSFAQLNGQIKFKTNFTIPNKPLQLKELGKSTHNFYYKVKFSTDKKSPTKREAICLLQIGENISKFFEYNQLRQDSIIQKYDKKEILNAREVEEILNRRVAWSTEIIKFEEKLNVQDKFRDLYQYEETKPKFKWKVEEGSKIILNYSCNKATMEFGGRNYTAWYAKGIPINNGPYKFEGLPGLILEIYDSTLDFHFEAIAVDQTPLPIYVRNDKKIFVVSKEKFRSVQISYYENPGFFHGNAFGADGKELPKNSKKLPYNLIELE